MQFPATGGSGDGDRISGLICFTFINFISYPFVISNLFQEISLGFHFKMRGIIINQHLSNHRNPLLFTLPNLFSSSSSPGGSGRGRGRGSGGGGGDVLGLGVSVPGKPTSDSPPSDPASAILSPGLGHGRGKPHPIPPAVTPSMSRASVSGRGRAFPPLPVPPPDSQNEAPDAHKKPNFFQKEEIPDRVQAPAEHKKPISFQKEEIPDLGFESQIQSPDAYKRPIFIKKEEIPDRAGPVSRRREEELKTLTSSVLSALSPMGAGRGKADKAGMVEERKPEENRHLSARKVGGRGGRGEFWKDAGGRGRLGSEGEHGVEGRGFRGRGGRGGRSGRSGRGFGLDGGGMNRRRGRGGMGRRGGRGSEDSENEVYLGDNSCGDRLAKHLGPEKMEKLDNIIDNAAHRVLPSPLLDSFADALHTNLLIECEPEYMMEDFGTNPDIHDKPPMPLKEMLEKVKPFLVSYERIKSQKEWEELVEQAMMIEPEMQKLVDFYGGALRITAKQQQAELEKIAETLPENAPSSVRNFTARALLSLQSNPGWGFDKKCWFMKELVKEVSTP